MTKEELQVILEKHKEWVNNEKGGERADLSGADLSGANLSGANFSRANFSGANFWEANLSGADFSGANLSEADFSRANLWEANLSGADLSGANLSGANFSGANLSEADLSGANLSGANLWEANLSGADLWGADLSRANFSGADLDGVKNIDKAKNFPFPDLYILRSVKGKICAYKIVNKNNEGIFNGGLKYEIGKIVEVEEFDDDERILCGKGINVATLTWCQSQKTDDTQEILEVEFEAKDIVAIPYTTDGKFRIKKCKVIREVKA